MNNIENLTEALDNATRVLGKYLKIDTDSLPDEKSKAMHGRNLAKYTKYVKTIERKIRSLNKEKNK